jgi:signal transduction histidine kinase
MILLYKNASLAVKLNLLVLLVLAVLLVGVVLLLIHNTQNLTQEIGGERIAEEVNIIQSRLAEIEKQLLVDTNFVVTSVSFIRAVANRDPDDTSDIITTANLSLEMDDIAVVDGDGKRLVDTRIDDDLTQEDDLLRRALIGSTTTALLIENNDDTLEISIAGAAPVVSTSGNKLGAMQMSRHISDDFLKSLTFGQKGIHLGLIYQNRIVARSDGQNHIPENVIRNGIPLDPSSVQAAQSGEAVILDELVLGEGGVPHTLAYTPVLSGAETPPVVIMILVELEEIFLFQNSTLFNTIVVFAALTLLTLAIIYANIYQTVIRPLYNLKTTAQTMTGGQYAERVPVSTADEVGQLAVAFNEMASAIQQREVSLQAAREQAERADRVKSMFLASVSHELRTPLNAIINLTKFVGLGMYGAVNEEQTDILQKVEARSKHLLNLINDVLDISKIESGSLELFVEDDLKIDDIVRQAVDTAQSLSMDKPVAIVHEIAPALPSLTGDAQRIQQIVLNLLSNAYKFTEEGEITVKVYQQESEIIISIRDSGPGIEPENREVIFEAFRQTKDGLRKGEGTGLGLAISRRLAEAHGGRVWFESVLGQGSTFYVALPVQTSLLPTL